MILKIDKPNPKQREFFLSRKRYIGYGGARGGGKSWALRTKFVLLALRYPRLRLLLLRKTLGELRENHLLPLLSLLNGIAEYKATERAFYFPNGSRLKLGFCRREEDVYQYQGQEYDVIGLEECTHFTYTQVQFLLTCNRNTRGDFSPRAYFTGNPGGTGHGWFKRLFVKGEYEGSERGEDYEFIPATVDDNHILCSRNPEYVNVLDNLPEKLKQAHRYGNWDIFDGQYFEEFRDNPEGYFNRKFTHVIAPFDIPAGYRLFRSFDFGYARPFSMGWWAMDFDGRFYRILELYGCTGEANVGVKWTPEEIFEKAAEIEKNHPYLAGRQIYGVADPSIWDSSKGESVAATAEKHGIYFERGDNKRLAGWMQMRYRLRFDEEGYPLVYIFSTCAHCIRTLPTLVYDHVRVEDLDSNGEDHIADEMRYLFMERPVPPKQSVGKARPVYNPLA